MGISFADDTDLVEAYALLSRDCVDMARSQFGLHIDDSVESVQFVEWMAGQLHHQIVTDTPSPESIDGLGEILGGHLAHVLTRHHGWAPGWILDDADADDDAGARRPGLDRASEGRVCDPLAKVRRRLVDGHEHNLLHYFRYLTHPDDFDHAAHRAKMIESDWAAQRHAIAINGQEEFVADLREMNGDFDGETLAAQAVLDGWYSVAGRNSATVGRLAMDVRLHASMLGDEHPQTLRSTSALALELWEERRWEEAFALVAGVEESFARLLGTDHDHYRATKGVREGMQTHLTPN